MVQLMARAASSSARNSHPSLQRRMPRRPHLAARLPDAGCAGSAEGARLRFSRWLCAGWRPGAVRVIVTAGQRRAPPPHRGTGSSMLIAAASSSAVIRRGWRSGPGCRRYLAAAAGPVHARPRRRAAAGSSCQRRRHASVSSSLQPRRDVRLRRHSRSYPRRRAVPGRQHLRGLRPPARRRDERHPHLAAGSTRPASSRAVSLRAVRLIPRSRSLTERGLSPAARASSSGVSRASARSCLSSPANVGAGSATGSIVPSPGCRSRAVRPLSSIPLRGSGYPIRQAAAVSTSTGQPQCPPQRVSHSVHLNGQKSAGLLARPVLAQQFGQRGQFSGKRRAALSGDAHPGPGAPAVVALLHVDHARLL